MIMSYILNPDIKKKKHWIIFTKGFSMLLIFFLFLNIMGVKNITKNYAMGLKGKDCKQVREKKEGNLTEV